MNKKFVFFPLCVMCLLNLTGCKEETRDYLTFFVWGDTQEVSWYEQIAEAYENQGGMHIKVQPNTGDYYNTLNIQLGSKKSAPDIFFTEMGEVQSQLNQNKLLNLSNYIDNGEFDVQTASNPDGKIKLWNLNDAYKYDGSTLGNGSYYAVIKDYSPDFVMWYNKDHIDEYNTEHPTESLKQAVGYVSDDEYPSEKIPMTWDQFAEMSYRLTKKTGNVTRYGTMLDRVPWKHLMEFIQMQGSNTFDSNNKYFNATDPGVIEAFKFFIDLQKGPKASAPEIGVSGFGSGELFANGQVSTCWFGSWAYSNYNWNATSFEIGRAPAPVPAKDRPLTEDDTYLAASGMISLGVYANTPNASEAIKFLNFYMTYGQEFMAKKGYNIPGNQLVAESEKFLDPSNSQIRKINNYFYNLGLKYTHTLKYNQYVSQLVFEKQVAKHVSVWFNNYSADTYTSILNKIASDFKNEID